MKRTKKLFLATTVFLLMVTVAFGSAEASVIDLVNIVESTTPANGATNVGIYSPITVKFKKNVSDYAFSVKILDEAGNRIDAETLLIDDYTLRVKCELGYNTKYDVTITMRRFLSIYWYSFSFTTQTWPELPEIIEITPYDGEENVSINSPIIIRFSKPIGSRCIEVTIKKDNGDVVYAAETMISPYTLRVDAILESDTEYHVTVRLLNPYKILGRYSFTTERGPDVPRIDYTTPSNGACNVSVNSPITIKFYGEISPYTVDVTVEDSEGNEVEATQRRVAHNTVRVDAALTYGMKYTVTVNVIPPYWLPDDYTAVYTFSFFTEKDMNPPYVVYTNPVDGATGVSVNSPIIIGFSERLSPYEAYVSIWDEMGSPVDIQKSMISPNVARVEADLKPSTKYFAYVNIVPPQGMVSIPGKPYTFSFSTESINWPQVVSTSPGNGSTGVSTDCTITIQYSGSIDQYGHCIELRDSSGILVPTTYDLLSGGNVIRHTAQLSYNKNYTVSVWLTYKNENGPKHTFGFSTASQPVAWPEVVYTVPASGATNVSVDSPITIQYSSSISQYGYVLEVRNSAGDLIQVGSNTSTTTDAIRVTPNLAYNTHYTVTVKLYKGGSYGPLYTFGFKTVSYDTSWPQVTSTSPVNGATGVDTDCEITVCFSKSLAGYNHYLEIRDSDWNLTHTPVLIESGSNVIKYKANLARNTKYNVVVKLSRTGTYETVHTFSFTTQGYSALPQVTSTVPSNGQKNVSVHPVIRIRFSSSIDPYNVSVTVRDDYGDSVYAVQTYTDSRTVELEPDLEPDRRYVVAVKLKPLSGGEYTLVHSFSFYTGYGYSSGKRFSDVPEWHWAYEAISYMADRGIISGFTDGTFRPDETVTREQFAKIMVLALDLPLINPSTPTFEDVDRSHWAYRYIESAKSYLTGYKSGNYYYYRGSEGAVREDMACALVKAKGYSYSNVNESRLWSIFNDADSISSALRKFVLVAYDRGLIRGYTDRTFRPQGTLTRAEAAKLLYEASIVD